MNDFDYYNGLSFSGPSLTSLPSGSFAVVPLSTAPSGGLARRLNSEPQFLPQVLKLAISFLGLENKEMIFYQQLQRATLIGSAIWLLAMTSLCHACGIRRGSQCASAVILKHTICFVISLDRL